MAEFSLPPVPGCYDGHPGFDNFCVDCIPDADLAPGELKTGGRTVFVRPVNNRVCAGQFGTFQVINGLGGQIYKGYYLGNSHDYDQTADSAHKIPIVSNDLDCMEPSEVGIAIKDRGRWYVIKLAQSAISAANIGNAVVVGGNADPFTGSSHENAGEYGSYRPWVFAPDKGAFTPVKDIFIGTWDGRHVLPDDYAHGDYLPGEKALPSGLGFARLQRGTFIGPYAWNADRFDENTRSSAIPDQVPTLVQAHFTVDDLNVIVVALTEPITLAAGATDPSHLEQFLCEIVPAVGEVTEENTETLDVIGLSVSGNFLRVTVSGDLPTGTDKLIRLTIPADTVEDTTGDALPNPNITASVFFGSAARCYVPILWLWAGMLKVGDLIQLGEAVTVVDEDDEEAIFYQVSGVTSSSDLPSGLVIGGNQTSPAFDGRHDAILSVAEVPTIPAWDDIPEDINYEEPPGPLEDGYGLVDLANGFALAEAVEGDFVFPKPEDRRDRVLRVFNTRLPVFVSQGDTVLNLRPRRVDDGSGTNRRVVWDVFA